MLLIGNSSRKSKSTTLKIYHPPLYLGNKFFEASENQTARNAPERGQPCPRVQKQKLLVLAVFGDTLHC